MFTSGLSFANNYCVYIKYPLSMLYTSFTPFQNHFNTHKKSLLHSVKQCPPNQHISRDNKRICNPLCQTNITSTQK